MDHQFSNNSSTAQEEAANQRNAFSEPHVNVDELENLRSSYWSACRAGRRGLELGNDTVWVSKSSDGTYFVTVAPNDAGGDAYDIVVSDTGSIRNASLSHVVRGSTPDVIVAEISARRAEEIVGSAVRCSKTEL